MPKFRLHHSPFPDTPLSVDMSSKEWVLKYEETPFSEISLAMNHSIANFTVAICLLNKALEQPILL